MNRPSRRHRRGQQRRDTELSDGEGRPIRRCLEHRPADDTTINLTFLDKGRFVWRVDEKGKNHVLQGRFTSGNGLLTLAQDVGPPIVGNVSWTNDSHFNFKVPGAGG